MAYLLILRTVTGRESCVNGRKNIHSAPGFHVYGLASLKCSGKDSCRDRHPKRCTNKRSRMCRINNRKLGWGVRKRMLVLHWISSSPGSLKCSGPSACRDIALPNTSSQVACEGVGSCHGLPFGLQVKATCSGKGGDTRPIRMGHIYAVHTHTYAREHEHK